jgi:hypothetical protein
LTKFVQENFEQWVDAFFVFVDVFVSVEDAVKSVGLALTLRVHEDYSTSVESSAQSAVFGLQVLNACGGLSFEPARYACRHQSKERSGPYEHRSMLPVAQTHLQLEFSNTTPVAPISGHYA